MASVLDVPALQFADYSQGINALGRGIEQRFENQRTNALAGMVGQAVETGDYAGGAKALIGAGDIKSGLSLLELSQNDREAAEKKIARAIQMADTPEKWSRVVPVVAKSLGQHGERFLQEFGDFSKRDAAAAMLSSEDDEATYGLSPIYGQDAQGNTVLLQASNKGGVREVQMPEGVTPTSGIDRVDTGTEILFTDKRTGNVIQVVPKDVAGEEAEKVKGKATGEITANKPKIEASMRDLQQQWQTVDAAIDQAIKEADWNAAGVGSWLNALPATDAYNLARTLDTIKANIGFDKLQNMRDNSPTGGALGQVSEFENRLLQAVRGSLDQAQSPKQLKANLEQIKADLKALQADRKRAFDATYGDLVAGPRDPNEAPEGVDPEDWRFMSEEDKALWR